jgi:hypothetical protein
VELVLSDLDTQPEVSGLAWLVPNHWHPSFVVLILHLEESGVELEEVILDFRSLSHDSQEIWDLLEG